MSPDEKLASLGYPLDRTLMPGAIYQSVVIDGTTAYVSGCLPFDGEGNLTSTGKVISQVSVEEARKAAALCAANILRQVRKEVGTLDKVERILRLTGYVNSDPDFTDQHLVINGASQLMVDVFGPPGIHARSAIGMVSLPRGTSVEVEAIVKLRGS